MTTYKITRNIVWMIVFPLILIACKEGESSARNVEEDGRRLKILATTTIVADIVKEIGGDQVDVSVLLPVGTDPHSYQPTPQDLARAVEAELIFINGAGLEGYIQPMLENTTGVERIIDVSNGIFLITIDSVLENAEEAHDFGGDPHTWTDPNNVKIWVENISRALMEADALHADYYQENAKTYTQALESLDNWVSEQVRVIPPERRKLLFDHHVFGYYAKRYGFDVIGAIIPSFSTLAEPSAQELAEIEQIIRSLGVPAIFVGSTVNANIADQITQDTGVKIIRVYTGSLSEETGEASSYLEYIRYNTQAIIEALK
jgi:ABC-type Zn uptake system ZnuABC Zn-binding protein ZnuA